MDIRLFFNAFLLLVSYFLCQVSSSSVSIDSGFKRQLLQPGDNITLECKATGQFFVTVTWLLDGLPLQYATPQVTKNIPIPAHNPYETETGSSLQSKYSIATSNEMAEDANSDDVVAREVEEAKKNTNESLIVIESTTATPEAINRQLPPVNNFNDNQILISQNIPITGEQTVTVTSSLSLNKASVQDGGIYTCVAQDAFRRTASWREKIAVAGPLSLRKNRPILALLDSVVIIPCTVLGSVENFAVKWFYRKVWAGEGTDVSISDLPETWTSMPNDVRQKLHENGSLEISEVRKANEGIYMCKVELNDQTETAETSLKINVPPMIKPFKWTPVRVGQPFAEMCAVTEGDPPLNIYWKKDGVTIQPSDRIEMTRSEKSPSLSLTMSGATLQSSGDYSCCASNNVTTTCASSALVVLDPPKIVHFLPTISAMSGNTVEVKCEATGYPKPNITWKRVADYSTSDYIAIPARIDVKPTKENEVPKISQTEGGSLIIINASSPDAGKYLCRAVNEVDESSNFVSLQVHNPVRILEISGTEDVIYGNDVTIDCSFWGDDVINVTWLKEGTEISADDRMRTTVVENGLLDSLYPMTVNRLTITNTTRSDTGLYTCLAKNKYGMSKRNIDVLVRAPPMAPKAFAISDRGTSFLRMVVSPGEDDGGSRIQRYQLTYLKVVQKNDLPTPPQGRLTPTIVPAENTAPVPVTQYALADGDVQEISLNDLECGAEYEVSIKAMNEIGASFEAVNLTDSTIGTVPVLPAVNELMVYRNQTSIVMDLRAWQNGGCPITDLWIEFSKQGDTEWNTTKFHGAVLEKALSAESEARKNDGVNPGHFVLAGLQVGTWYKVWSSACNVAGCNYVMYSLATLLPNGATVPPIEAEKKKTESDDGRFLVPMICGFGLVILLVLFLLLYRHKQRSKKVTRMKEAEKMASSLRSTRNGKNAPSSRMKVDLPDIAETSVASLLIETSVSITSDNDTSIQAAVRGDGNAQMDPFIEETFSERLDTLVVPHASSNDATLSQTEVSTSSQSTKSYNEGRKSLKDNAALAVFRDMASSDDESPTTESLMCDESAFGDSGTWSFFKPGTAVNHPKFDKRPPKTEHKSTARRKSSSSSGTDEELAQVFGLPCSKWKQNSEDKQQTIKSDVNENYRPSSNSGSRYNKKPPPAAVHPQKREKLIQKRGKINELMQQELRSNSTGMVQKSNPRHFRPVNGEVTRETKRLNTAVQPRPNPAAFDTTNHTPFNIHRPNHEHQRGHTYSNDNTGIYKGVQATTALPKSDTINPSPYGERQWVDTYDSRCSTNRSQPPSWGSIELDKQGYLTPPPSANHTRRDRDTPKYRTPEIHPDNSNQIYDCPTKDGSRKLDTDSPRDSGIGSDEGPSSRHMTASISPPTMKINARKSLESLDETDMKKADHTNFYGGGNAIFNARKEALYLMSPPLTPPMHQTKLAPHIFVNISPKCNTTPTRHPRSSYPPCGEKVQAESNGRTGQPRRLDCLPTPPPSGPNTPVNRNSGQSKAKKESWLIADLDKRNSSQHKNNSRLRSDNTTPANKTTYPVNHKDRTWQTSTLV